MSKLTPRGSITYPALVIVCDVPQFEDQVLDTLLNPRVIVEVLSESTEKYDRGSKFENYRKLSSLKEYVLASQDRPLIERYVRQGDATWVLTAFSDPTQTFAFGTVAVQVPLAEIYRGVTFADTTARNQRRIDGDQE